MLARVSAIRSLNALKPRVTGTSSVLSRRWESSGSGGGDKVPASSGSSQVKNPYADYKGPVLKAWEEHPEVTEYELSCGTTNLMIGHNFIAHQEWHEGNSRRAKHWVRMFIAVIPFWLCCAIIAETYFNLRPYLYWPVGIARLNEFDKDNYVNYTTDPNHFYQDFDEELQDPNEDEDDEDEEDED